MKRIETRGFAEQQEDGSWLLTLNISSLTAEQAQAICDKTVAPLREVILSVCNPQGHRTAIHDLMKDLQ